jgi:hypothetical protein
LDYAIPGQAKEATTNWGIGGLVGTLAFTILDNDGGTTTARTTAGVTEIAPGVYAINYTAPAAEGQYTLDWDDGEAHAVDDLTVTATATIQITSETLTPGVVLTYAEQKAAVYEKRFPSSSPVAQWLAAAYADIWNAHPWTFKRITGYPLYTTADGLSTGLVTATPLMPATFGRVLALFDQDGAELEEFAPHEFEHTFTQFTAMGQPEAYTVVNRQIILGPPPNAAYPYRLSFRRRLATRNSAGTVQSGFYIADTDIPLWDDHSYLLVIRAKLIGLRDRSDPTATDLEGEYVRLLDAMREEYGERPRGVWSPAWP